MAGNQVKPKNMAPNKAKLNDSAIGRNIFPSTSPSERIGMNTMSMINCPKMAEFIILEAPLKVILSISFWRPSPVCLLKSEFRNVSDTAINSTIITAPSIIIPKSSAPRLIRFTSIPKRYIMAMVKSIDSGMMDEITSADRKLPKISSTTKNIIMKPMVRFSNTVNDVLPISSLRSTIGLIKTPSGSVF